MHQQSTTTSRWPAAARRGRCVHLKCTAGTATATKAPVKVLLRIPYRVNFGQTVVVVGTGDLLGHWDPAKAVRMNWNTGDFWQAEISVEPGSATQLEYKYVVLNSNSTISHWKPGQNYKLDVLAARGTRVLVTETWDDGPRHVEVDMENQDPAPPQPPQTTSTQPPPQQRQAQASRQQGGDRNANGSSSNCAVASNGMAAAPSRNGKEPPAAVPPNSSLMPQPAVQESAAVVAAAAAPLTGTAVIQQEAQAAVSELQDALDRQVNALQRVADPTAIEVLMGDRLLAAANSKAVALNRAVRAAEALPMLPSGGDVGTTRSSSSSSASTPPAPQQQSSGKKPQVAVKQQKRG